MLKAEEVRHRFERVDAIIVGLPFDGGKALASTGLGNKISALTASPDAGVLR